MNLVKACFFFLMLCIATSVGQDQCQPRDPSATCDNRPCEEETLACKKASKICECTDICGWSCVRIGCQALVDPDNGNIEYSQENREIGSSAIFSCMDGYLLSGTEVLECREDKTWDANNDASCTLDCLREDQPGRTCMKTCSNDDDCSTDRGRYCVCDGVCGSSCITTSGEHCDPSLVEVENAVVTLDPSTAVFRTVATIACSPGYNTNRGEREIQRTCLGSHDWSEGSLLCIPDDACQNPPEVDHATHVAETHYANGDIVRYSCDFGYAIRGSASYIQCVDGNWEDTVVTCQAKSCGYPGDINDGRVVETVYTFPNSVTYNCDDGFKLTNRVTRYCQTTQAWSGTAPSCIPIACPRLDKPANGQKDGSGNEYYDEVSFRCNEGYSLSGESTLTCQNDETWSAAVPTCTAYCPKPEEGVQWVFNDSCREEDTQPNKCGLSYTCDKVDYAPNKGIIWTCERGEWREDNDPICLPASCNTTDLPLDEYAGMRFEAVQNVKPMMETGHRLQVKCPDGCTISGPTEFIFCKNGKWKNVFLSKLPLCSECNNK